jgi:hypothetical protein
MTVRLEFDIDSEVYPELHAALSGLRSSRARTERMRQLAAAGLVWEKVRLHGATAVAATATAPLEPPAGVVMRADVTAAPHINAEPTPVAPIPAPARAERRRARPSRQDVEHVIRELPVLMDVVADVRPLSDPDDDAPLPGSEKPATWSAMNPYPDDLPDDVHTAPSREPADDDDAGELPDPALHVTALSHKPETRSRLMRMKERGLFKNG